MPARSFPEKHLPAPIAIPIIFRAASMSGSGPGSKDSITEVAEESFVREDPTGHRARHGARGPIPDRRDDRVRGAAAASCAFSIGQPRTAG